ncbi:MAG: hypothetical protein ABI877_02095 [Gemmatimonadaceae bacterium]
MTRVALGVTLAVAGDDSGAMLRPTPAAQRTLPVVTPRRQQAADSGGKDSAGNGSVRAEMRHVDFHIDSGIVLHIQRLRGTLAPIVPGKIPTLDDKRSFSLGIHSAEITIDTTSLSILLNRHVFGYKGSPLKKLHVSTEGDQLVQTGVMHKGVDMPFRIRATVGLTPDGRIRIHPTAVKLLGMGVTNAMKFFGVELGGLIKLQPGHGASIDGNDFILDALEILPPPRIRGRLTAITVGPGVISQTFSPTPGQDVQPLRSLDAATPNYMYFRNGTLRFGKLTMADADLLIVDKDPTTVFDFSLDQYNDQLVAGYSNSTTALGLIVHMPDFWTLGRKLPSRAKTSVSKGAHTTKK